MTEDAHHGLPKKEARYALERMGKGRRDGEPQACDEGCRWLGGTGWDGMLSWELMGGSRPPHRECVGT